MMSSRSLRSSPIRCSGLRQHGHLHPNLEGEPILGAKTFETIEELRAALVEFATHYNETWLVARHGNRTPAQVRAAQSQLDQNAMADLKLAA